MAKSLFSFESARGAQYSEYGILQGKIGPHMDEYCVYMMDNTVQNRHQYAQKAHTYF